jgi:predicted alpha/beta superfamily hydrolase
MIRILLPACATACLLFASPALRAHEPTIRHDRARIDTLTIPVPDLAPGGLRVRVFVPNGYDPQSEIGYPVLYINDGQDAEAVKLQTTLNESIDQGAIRPLLAVAIDMPKDRMGAYGFSERGAQRSLISPLRVGAIGTQAHAYSEWVATQLVPIIDARYRTRARPEARAILGWSLGAANALNLGWQYPEVFANVGAFSPSLWLSPKPDEIAGIQASRFAQRMIAAGAYHPGSRFFFAVGDAEETDDRDSDGVIDVLDDTRDLIDGWRVAGEAEPRAKGLHQLGHSMNLDHAVKATRADTALFVLAHGRHEQASWARMLPQFLRWAYAVHAPPLNATGRTESWQRMPSRHVDARDVDVWLPPSYGSDPQRRYPVLYMHDGQNLFDPALSYTGADWDIDGAMTRLIEAGGVREAIVVGVWNTPLRFAEYMPKEPVRIETVSSGVEGRLIGRTEDIRSDEYLRFLVEELKPFIETQYRTRPGRDHTFVMGSSMGGLISLYAAAQYPEVFGGVGAVSTHWPACDGCVIDWLGAHLPDPKTHRLYFDHGTATLDALYPPFQARMDEQLRERGYVEGQNAMTRRFEGAEHNEAAWRARVEIPLRFLLAR